jgi:hypothetical protein
MEAIKQKMAEINKNERTNTLKQMMWLCKYFCFAADILGSLAEGWKK